MSTLENMAPKKGFLGKKKKNGKNVRSAQEKKDDSVMNTNDSSIVSKRSVSKLYFPNEPDYYESFVNKYIKRNPLINRGYWLRMHAIEQVVRRFLEEDSDKMKAIVNLGCGYDPLPFQFWHRHASSSQRATFVDVDYPQLIGRKRDRIFSSEPLRNALLETNLRPSQMPVFIRSDKYLALGCDLRDLETLDRALKTYLDVSNTCILFVAEVSLTYMPVADSDSLIRWASTLDHARFCLLEQCLPQGTEHPFAQTMLRHFDKLHTPIQAIKQYPSLIQQVSRFEHAGWSTTSLARNLWDLWSDDGFTLPTIRHGLDAVEPFDEWEEFALFAGHYFLLVASNAETARTVGSAVVDEANADTGRTNRNYAGSLTLTHKMPPRHPHLNLRRFGAAFTLGEDTVVFHGGQGSQSRLASVDVLKRETVETRIQPCALPPPQARMCHTVTHLSHATALLVGGRASPTHALADCWLIKDGTWQQVHDLTPARFRSSSVRVDIPSGESSVEGVLVFGGRLSDGTVLDEWTLWSPAIGWHTIPVDGPRPSARFGAAISTMGSTQSRGLLVGGMAPSGTVLDDLWEWHVSAAPHPQLKFIDRTNNIRNNTGRLTYGRLGANLVHLGNSLLLIGGVSRKELHSLADDFLLISEDPDGAMIHIKNLVMSLPEPTWPLLVGAMAVAVGPTEVMIAGGGAVCFSMGSFWNDGYITISTGVSNSPSWKASMSQSAEIAKPERPDPQNRDKRAAKASARTPGAPKVTMIQRIYLSSSDEFSNLLGASQPAIIEGLDLGPCTELWTPDYLKATIGTERNVVIHECESDRMTFKDKNFSYVKKPFGDFLDGIATGSRAYLRAVSSSQPNKMPTKLEDDFPSIASDFHLPKVFDFVRANLHSSPLRISGPVALWLHYDVLANILCQVRGSKTLHLYPPSDVKYLSYPPGGSSSNVDVLTSNDPVLRRTHPHVASLKPGDILYIPPMWSHTAKPENGVSIALNIFFRNLENGYAAGKDVYGNRDLQAYENGRRDVDRIAKAFKNIPRDIAKFYLDRLTAELQEKADASEKHG